MDEATRDEVEAWLTKAHRDLDSARRLFGGDPPFRDTATYHCQQAAEKALKALLTAAEVAFPRTHDLTVLVGLAAARHPELARLDDAAIVLTPYATLFRYPSTIVEPDDEDVRQAIQLATSLLEAVERQLVRQGPRAR
jgi:HEPN domain-containing protein